MSTESETGSHGSAKCRCPPTTRKPKQQLKLNFKGVDNRLILQSNRSKDSRQGSSLPKSAPCNTILTKAQAIGGSPSMTCGLVWRTLTNEQHCMRILQLSKGLVCPIARHDYPRCKTRTAQDLVWEYVGQLGAPQPSKDLNNYVALYLK